MTLKRLEASGRIYIVTPTKVDCDEFSYDYATGNATLRSADRMVAIITTGNPTPLRVKNVIWNLAEDKITATDVSGGAPW